MGLTIHVKNMVCARCIKSVHLVFDRLGYAVEEVSLGQVRLKDETIYDAKILKSFLVSEGFDLMEDRKAVMVERAKTLIIQLIQTDGFATIHTTLSTSLATQLGKDYHHLSTLFSSLENTTIEKFVILQKTERVKELLIYNELTLAEIAHRLAYSSAAYLSAQFKQQTGFTPSQFKKLKSHHRIALDEVATASESETT